MQKKSDRFFFFGPLFAECLEGGAFSTFLPRGRIAETKSFPFLCSLLWLPRLPFSKVSKEKGGGMVGLSFLPSKSYPFSPVGGTGKLGKEGERGRVFFRLVKRGSFGQKNG